MGTASKLLAGFSVFAGLFFNISNIHADSKVWPYNPDLKPAPAPGAWKADPALDKCWHLESTGTLMAWNTTKGSPAVTIGIVDSGINYNHPELAPNLKRKMSEWPFDKRDDDGNGFIDDVIGFDFVNDRSLPWDRTGHGTYVAAMAAAVEGNGQYGAGVCPRCSILPVRYLNGEGLGDTEEAIKSIDYAVGEGVSVLNLSFAAEGYDKDLYQALVRADQRDIVVVTSAGNDSESNDRQSIYPANYSLPNLITVAAVEKDGSLTDRSNWGSKKVHIGAPGTQLYGPWYDGTTWEKGDGTSFSAPIVAGAAGLIRAANPRLTARQTVQIILRTAKKNSHLKRKLVTEGVLDVHAAVDCAVTLRCLK